MKIAVLFDGAGLARLGLEQAGHTCTGFEIDPLKHRLSRFVGSGNCILGDATAANLLEYDAVWASPPCQERSNARTQGTLNRTCYLDWCLQIDKPILWVENIVQFSLAESLAGRGQFYNAAQFLEKPIQNRRRIVEGRFKAPYTYRGFKYYENDLCPAITATEYKGCATDNRRASRYYGRKLTLEECAFHQGFEIPVPWWPVPPGMRRRYWEENLYEAIGNGVPVYMARAFGAVYDARSCTNVTER